MASSPRVTEWQPDRLRLFWRFVVDRHNVFLNRVYRKKPPPWTEDTVLASVYFTNVYRELDRGTRYIVEILDPKHKRTALDLLWNVIVYRMFNLTDTHHLLAHPAGYLRAGTWDGTRVKKLLHEVANQGERVFTGAFLVSNWGRPGSKIDLVVDNLTEILHGKGKTRGAAALMELLKDLQAAESMEAAHRRLTQLWGVAGFLAYEMIIDLCYHQAVLRFGENDWVHPGPGAVDGLRILTAPGTRYGKKAGGEMIRDLMEHQAEDREAAGVVLLAPPLTLRNVEHSLCEFQKYWRALVGGRNKRLYRVATASKDLSPWDPFPAAFVPIGPRRRQPMR